LKERGIQGVRWYNNTMGVIDEIKQRIDIVDVVSQYAKLTKSGRTFRALCPFHSEKNPSFFVYPEQQSWHCFGACNTGGDVFAFVMKKQGIDFGEALKLLAQQAGVTVPSRFEPGGESKEKQRLFQINDATTQYFHNLLNSGAGEKAQNYLRKRGLSEKTIADFKLGFSPDKWDALKQHLINTGYTEAELLSAGLIVEGEGGKTHDRFRHKLMFPISDSRGRITGFGARVLDDSLPKYVNSPQTPLFDKSSTLYGINLATSAIRQQDLAVIVEGYLDVITAHQNGFSNVVASMGTSVTEKQVSILKKLSKNMALALDADAAGEEATLRAVTYENTLDAEVKVIISPKGKDPDDVIKEDAKTWQRLVTEALPLVDYTFNVVTAGLDLSKASGKSQAVDKLLPLVAEINNPIRQAHYLQKLAQLLGVSERSIEAALARIKPKPGRARAPKAEAPTSRQPLLSSPKEEYCLALLLQHPELRDSAGELLPEYFENSENREIFIAWQESDKIELVREKLEPEIHEHFESLLTRRLLSDKIEQKYAECALDLREKFLRSLISKIEAVLAQEAESGGGAAELTKLKELDITANTRLAEVLAQKNRMRLEQRGVR
jgi:DNA primase